MKTGVVVLLLALTASCATHRYGREMPLTDAERAALTCEQIDVEISKVEAFLAQVDEGAPADAAVLGFLGDFGVGNSMEQSDARKSGLRRLRDLQELRYEKGCPGTEKPGPETLGVVVIASLVPNPVGSDKDNERITLRNDGDAPVSLSGWTLRNQTGQYLDISIYGTLLPGSELSIVRNGSRLSLDDQGGVIRLLDDLDQVVDEISYGAVAEGDVVQGH